jgi:adenosine deaminase
MSSGVIMCFLRHLSEDEALATLEEARPFVDELDGVGLDSSERGHPPSKFRAVFAECRRLGLATVAHAGEEGPAAYIVEALDALEARRIDHGVRCVEDESVLARLAAERVPLTVCPLSNIRLRVFDHMLQHTLPHMLDAGLCITVNSDDPAYFGGYVAENLLAVQEAFGLSRDEVAGLSRNAFEASFLDESTRSRLLAELEAYLLEPDSPSTDESSPPQ